MSPVRSRFAAALASVCLSLCACTLDGGEASLGEAARAKLPAGVVEALAAGEPRRLLLVVDDATGGAARLANDADDDDAARWPAAKADVEDLLAGAGLTADARWDELPIIPVTVDSLAGLAAVLDDARLAAVSEVQTYRTTDVESLALVGQPAAVATGHLGAGVSVAVLDTGADFARAPFHCTAAGSPACKIAFARDFAPDDGARDAHGHGSNVAGIVVATAPAARVLALDVFDGDLADSVTILAAYDWVLQHRHTYNVAAVNLSLGAGRADAPCGTDPLAVAFQTARDAGILTTVAAGNDAMDDATTWPACAPAAVSVGAVYDAAAGSRTFERCTDAVTAADRVTCFSNTAPFLTLLAPGAFVDAAGYRMAGTSQAAPHVAGAIAVLRAEFPTASAASLLTRLTATGRLIVDPRTRRATPRLDLARALGLTGAPTGEPPPAPRPSHAAPPPPPPASAGLPRTGG